MQKQIIELEKKAAFQEQMLEDLNVVILEQQKMIDQLQKDMAQFKEQIASDTLVRKQEDEVPPPHY